VNYFKFLTGVDKNIFREETLRNIFPEYLRNIKKYLSIEANFIEKLYNYWNSDDITYEKFEKFYEKNLPLFA